MFHKELPRLVIHSSIECLLICMIQWTLNWRQGFDCKVWVNISSLSVDVAASGWGNFPARNLKMSYFIFCFNPQLIACKNGCELDNTRIYRFLHILHCWNVQIQLHP